VPAAAVIPAPIAYIKVVAVKKPVVEFVHCPMNIRLMLDVYWDDGFLLGNLGALY
jgi:hypothetical protein